MGRERFCGAARLKFREKPCQQLKWLSRIAEVYEKQIISVSIYIDSTIARLIRFGSRIPPAHNTVALLTGIAAKYSSMSILRFETPRPIKAWVKFSE
jgi:hypothetical protein